MTSPCPGSPSTVGTSAVAAARTAAALTPSPASSQISRRSAATPATSRSWSSATRGERRWHSSTPKCTRTTSAGSSWCRPSDSTAHRQRIAEILASEPSNDPWIARISTGFADRSTALEQARRLNTPRFEPNQECADALLAELRAVPDKAVACGRIAVPTLLVHGAEDLRPSYVTDSLLEALPNAERVVLDGVAHYPWVEDPDSFQKVVRAFLS